MGCVILYPLSMCPKNLFFSILIVSAFFPVLAGASGALSWEDCIAKAAESNPDILSARSTLKSTDFKAKAAWNGFLPQVSGSASYNSGNMSSSSFGNLSTDTYSATVNVEQNLFSGFSDTGKVHQGMANRDASRSGLDNIKVKTSYNLKSAFASLLYAQDNSKLADDITKRREENAMLVELRFEGGMENQGSALLSKAFLEQARYDKHQAVRSIDVSRQQLAQVLGMEDFSSIKITGKIPIAEPVKDPNILEIATQNPEYLQAVAKEKAAKAGITISRAQFFPQLEVFAMASRQGNKNSSASNNTTYGANVSVPIFNGLNNYFTMRSSQSDYITAKHNKDSIEEQILPKLKQAHADFLDAYEKLKVDKAFLQAAIIRAEISRNKYKNGLLSFEDWDIIENDLINKQKTVLLSEKNLYLAEAAWVQAQGKGVIP